MFDSAEGEAGVAGDHGVEEDGSALELGDEALLLGGVAGPGAGGEAEGGVVGDLDGLVEVAGAEEHGDGAEELFAVDGAGAGDVGEDGGLEVVAVAHHAFASGEEFCARGDGGFDLGFQLFDDLGCGEWADVGGVLQGVADAHGLHEGDETGLKGLVDGVVDDEALGGDAGLAGVDEAGADGGFDGGVEVGRGHDEEGVGAA